MSAAPTEFDYIVVGGGSSGAVIATRLSEQNHSVLLLEAGPPDKHLWIDVPIGFAKILAHPKFMWHLETQPQPELNDRKLPASRGKVLGGSSAVNGLIYVRGTSTDYDEWVRLGATGWSYDEVLPYFRKAERYEHGESELHGGSGPLGVEGARWRNPLTDAAIDAAASLGLKRVDDFCQRDPTGTGYYQMTTWKGRRSSTGRAYLSGARSRANLSIVTGALVTRIEFSGRQATGVAYELGDRKCRATARREIVLSAGSFSTPHLLQLSGVGPASLLSQHGIPVLHDLPGVGEQLMDHVLVKRSYQTSSSHTFNAMMNSLVSRGLAGLRYLTARTGQMSVGAALAGGFAHSRPGLADPDIQFFYMPFEAGDYSGKLPPISSFQMACYQNRPQSRGHVRMKSPDPHVLPAVSPNYLSTEGDMRAAVEGFRFLGRLGDAAPMERYHVEEMQPRLADETDDAVIDYIRATASPAYHHIGSCRMGQDDLAVVDPQLRVRGLSGLRVADGSIIPSMISGNTNAVCIMIGERAADLLLRTK
jgi:choline dehydrogenase